MEEKVCNKCNELKPLRDFHRATNHKDGFRNDCKRCAGEYHKARNVKRRQHISILSKKRNARRKRELLFFIYKKYYLMKTRVNGTCSLAKKYKTYKYVGMDICSKNEFIRFAIKDWNLKYLFCDWINSGHKPELVPSIDRLNDNVGYTLDNIQFVTLRDNIRKQREKSKSSSIF